MKQACLQIRCPKSTLAFSVHPKDRKRAANACCPYCGHSILEIHEKDQQQIVNDYEPEIRRDIRTLFDRIATLEQHVTTLQGEVTALSSTLYSLCNLSVTPIITTTDTGDTCH